MKPSMLLFWSYYPTEPVKQKKRNRMFIWVTLLHARLSRCLTWSAAVGLPKGHVTHGEWTAKPVVTYPVEPTNCCTGDSRGIMWFQTLKANPVILWWFLVRVLHSGIIIFILIFVYFLFWLLRVSAHNWDGFMFMIL
jgi:hypothetical protein